MNYLAHLFLSHKNPDIAMGNFLGDLVRSNQVEQLPKAIIQGIELHRKIDTFTDHHPEVKKAVEIIQPEHRRYAPVVVDIYYDYFLAKHWEKYTQEPLQDFANYCYQLFRDYEQHIPKKHKERVVMMSQYNWLIHYGNIDELHRTFMKVAKRAKFDNQFDKATQTLEKHYDELETSFLNFFPDVWQMTLNVVQDKM